MSNRTWLDSVRFAAFALLFLAACGDSATKKSKAYKGPTYHRDVAPLLDQHCLGCHISGGIAPFALDNFEAAKAFAGAIAEKTRERLMPPFNADNSGDCNTYQHARWLSDAEIETFAAWAKGGAVEGAPVAATGGSTAVIDLDHISATLEQSRAYTPDKDLADDYRCFVIDPGVAGKQFLTGYSVRPGQPKEVHHMILYQAKSDAASALADEKNAATGGNGYTCFGGADVDANMVAGWAPGSSTTLYPEGSGIPIESDRKLIMQIHYHTEHGVTPDRTQIDLQLEDFVNQEMLIVGLADTQLRLPPGQSETSTSTYLSLENTIPIGGINLLGVFPHMHKLGTRLKVEILDGADGDQCLVDVKRWNFDWQQLFLYSEPLYIRPKGMVKLTCTYDTTSRKDVVTWGEGTNDEMCLNFFFVTAGYSF
jgi:hypothetical protein